MPMQHGSFGGKAPAGTVYGPNVEIIVFSKAIGDYRAGNPYRVSSTLARHYCDVLKVASRVGKKENPEDAGARKPSAASAEDRAMAPPPRGRRKEQ